MNHERGGEAVDDVDPLGMVESWREHAVPGPDPVTLAVIEGLARRAAAQHGAARREIMHRIETLLSTVSAASRQAVPTFPTLRPEKAATSDRRSALEGLSELVDRLGRSPGVSAAVASLSQTTKLPVKDRSRKKPSPGATIHAASPPPLKAVTAFKGTWSRLRADQRLRQVLAQVPPMAGPLNSAHVVNRALQALRELSPQYLDAFILQVDALLWIEQASGGDLTPRVAAAPTEDRPRPADRRARKA